jgi:hypothetical protein
MKTNVLVKGVCILAVSCCLVECKKDDNGKTEEAKLTAIKVDPASLNLFTGETKSITATPEPAEVKATFTWTSAQTSIATVNNNGEVTGVAEGTTTITVSSGDISATVNVEVSDIYMTDIDVDTEPLTLFIYDELQLEASPIPANAVDGNLFYRSSDPDVVTVDAEGKVLALAAGTATLRVYHLAIAKEIEVTVADFSNIDEWGVSVSSWAGGDALNDNGLSACHPLNGGNCGAWTWEPGNVLLSLDWFGGATGWHTATGASMPQWLAVDMKDRKKLTGFYYLNASGFGSAYPLAFTIDVRNSESEEWTTVLEAEDFPQVAGLQELVFADQEGFEERFGATFVWARYYRINITAVISNYDYTYVSRLKPIEPEAPPTE